MIDILCVIQELCSACYEYNPQCELTTLSYLGCYRTKLVMVGCISKYVLVFLTV